MFASLILAAAALGQTTYEMPDETGFRWSSPDIHWLRRWTGPEFAGRRNAAPDGLPAGNYGVSVDHYPESGGREWFGGNAPRPNVGATAERPKRVHVTVICPDADAARAVVAGWDRDPGFHSLRLSLGDALAVQAYASDNPLVADVGLADGVRDTSVVIQREDGAVIARHSSDPGSAVIAGEVRQRDPTYDPTADPSGVASGLGWEWWVILLVGVCLVLTGRGGRS